LQSGRQRKLLLALLLIGAAGAAVWFAASPAEDASPDDPALAKAWYCHRCDAGFLLTPAEYEKTIARGMHPAYQSPEGGGDMTASVLIVQCPTCGGVAVAAQRCEKHGVIYDPRDGDPEKRRCPQCDPPE